MKFRAAPLIASLIVAGMSLTACGGSDGGNDAKANAGDADKADLVFWGWDTGNTMKALIADFEKANPGIKNKATHKAPSKAYPTV